MSKYKYTELKEEEVPLRNKKKDALLNKYFVDTYPIFCRVNNVEILLVVDKSKLKTVFNLLLDFDAEASKHIKKLCPYDERLAKWVDSLGIISNPGKAFPSRNFRFFTEDRIACLIKTIRDELKYIDLYQ